MIRKNHPRLSQRQREIQNNARNLSVEIADRTLRTLAAGRWSYDFPMFKEVQVLAIEVLRMNNMMQPVCEQSFAEACVALMAEIAHRIVQCARYAVAWDMICLGSLEDEILINQDVDEPLAAAYSIRIVTS